MGVVSMNVGSRGVPVTPCRRSSCISCLFSSAACFREAAVPPAAGVKLFAAHLVTFRKICRQSPTVPEVSKGTALHDTLRFEVSINVIHMLSDTAELWDCGTTRGKSHHIVCTLRFFTKLKVTNDLRGVPLVCGPLTLVGEFCPHLNQLSFSTEVVFASQRSTAAQGVVLWRVTSGSV